MSDSSLLIGDLALNPDKINDYMDAEYNDRWQEFAAGWGGAVVTLPPDDEIVVGQEVKSPQLAMPAALGKLDVTNESGVDSTHGPTGALTRGPVCSNVTSNPIEFFSHAIHAYKKSDMELEQWLAQKFVMLAINARKLDVLYALRGAIGATSTVSHVNDESSNSTKTFQLSDFLDTKAILGDAQADLRTCVMHSKVWNSLVQDMGLTGNYFATGGVAGLALMGQIPPLGNMNIILCDDGTKVAGASAGADAYYTFMLGEGAVEIHQTPNSPLFTAVVGLDKGARSTKTALEDHYGLVLPGMGMTTDATGNPTTAELYDTTNWSEAFSHDHRDFKAVYCKTLNG